jgi:hypothetical protein
MKMTTQSQVFSKIINGAPTQNFQITSNRKLMSAGESANNLKNKKQVQNLNSPLNEDIEMTTDTFRSDNLSKEESEPEIGAI